MPQYNLVSPERCSTLILETQDCGSPLVSGVEGEGRDELGLVRGGGEIGEVKFVRGEVERGRKRKSAWRRNSAWERVERGGELEEGEKAQKGRGEEIHYKKSLV